MLPLAIVATITGDVVGARAHWTGDGDRIVTEATVRTPDGTEIVVSQLGGSVDGIGMRSWPGPDLLAPGMRVQLSVHDAADLSARTHHIVDDAVVLAPPPGALERFVRTGPTKSGHYLYWESGCIFLTLDPAGTKAVPFDQVQQVVSASIAAWTDGTAGCSYMQIMQQSAPDGTTTLEVGKDYVNVLKFRDASWCRPASGSDEPPRCYPDAAAGITTAIYVDDKSSDRDGAILDADIEINDVDFAVAVDGVSNSLQTCQAELQNTLTHELGHLQGLEHTCRVETDPDRVDDQGAAVPLCTDTTDPKILSATMYPFQDCGETIKETLADDDIAGVCAIYPTASDPGTCEAAKPGSSGGCSTGGMTGGATAGLVIALAGWRRRRPR